MRNFDSARVVTAAITDEAPVAANEVFLPLPAILQGEYWKLMRSWMKKTLFLVLLPTMTILLGIANNQVLNTQIK
jgi:hypothetical protein